MDKKIVFITGVSRGIGLELAKCFFSDGYFVIGTSRSEFNLHEELGSEKCLHIPLDVTDREQASSCMEKLKDEDIVPNVLINNAGITKDNLLMRMSEEDYDRVMEVNMKSVFNMTKACQRTFLKNRKGSIINMSSVVGVKGNAGQSNYAASKSAIIGFSKSIALELGSRNIRCNVIAPGFIKTEMTDKLSEEVIQSWNDNIPLKRPGESEDVANLCLFLASDLSNYITGQVINVDGGLLT